MKVFVRSLALILGIVLSSLVFAGQQQIPIIFNDTVIMIPDLSPPLNVTPSDRQFVTNSYGLIFNRAPTSTENSQRLRQISDGKTHAEVLAEIWDSLPGSDNPSREESRHLVHYRDGLYIDSECTGGVILSPNRNPAQNHLDMLVAIRNTVNGNLTAIVSKLHVAPHWYYWDLNGSEQNGQAARALLGIMASANQQGWYEANAKRLDRDVFIMKKGAGEIVAFGNGQPQAVMENKRRYIAQLYDREVVRAADSQNQGFKIEGARLNHLKGNFIDYATSLNCFVADTLVNTDKGLVEIQNIAVGDRVLSTNEFTGETNYKPVLNTFVNKTESLVRVTIGSETITATSEHPFRVCDDDGTHRWVAASELKPGMEVVATKGHASVEKVALVEEKAETYNFEVEDWHTYHVGEQALLVHNSSTIPPLNRNEFPGVNFVDFELETGPGAAAVGPEEVRAQIAPIVIVLGARGAVLLLRTGLVRGLLQGGANALRNAVLGIGRMGPGGLADPLYVRNAIALRYSYYTPTLIHNPGHNLGYIFGHAFIRGPGSIRYVTPGLPLTASFTAVEFQSAYAAYLTRQGLGTLGAVEAFIHAPVFDNILTDTQLFDLHPNPHFSIILPDGRGSANIIGPVTYGGDFGFGF